MCLALYLASDHPLLVISERQYPPGAIFTPEWPREAQRFHTAELIEEQKDVRRHFSHPHVLYAGSYEGCACGFNQGRKYPEYEYDPEELKAAHESVNELVRYVLESRVLEIYACWFDDECETAVHHRRVTPEMLGFPDFFFRDRELLWIDHTTGQMPSCP